MLPKPLPVQRGTSLLDGSHASPPGAQIAALISAGVRPGLGGVSGQPSAPRLSQHHNWGPREVSWVLAGVGVCSIIVNAVPVGWVVRWLGGLRTVRAGLDHLRGRCRSARPHAGRVDQPGQYGWHRRSGAVRQHVRLVHRPQRSAASARRALAAGRGVAGHRLDHCLETGRAGRRKCARGTGMIPNYSYCARARLI